MLTRICITTRTEAAVLTQIPLNFTFSQKAECFMCSKPEFPRAQTPKLIAHTGVAPVT